MNHAKLTKLLALSLGILLISSSVSAQRAPSAAYDGDRKVKLAGIVTEHRLGESERVFLRERPGRQRHRRKLGRGIREPARSGKGRLETELRCI